MGDRPSGVVTFLFTDVEGSTRLWEEHPAAMEVALELHDEILRAVIDQHGGYVFSTAGDAFAAAFGSAEAALEAAANAQGELDAAAWPEEAAVRVRMGLHIGEAQERDGDYFGPAVNKAARIMSAGHGGQFVVSDALARVVQRGQLRSLGSHRLKDLAAPDELWQLGPNDFPSLSTLDLVVHNLPVQRTPLHGREAEVAEVVASLDTNRLVTLTAIGGAGKTRLGLAAAAEAVGTFSDGVFFVQFADELEARTPARTIAAALSIAVEGSDDHIASALAHSLAVRDMLLVLDNCEHVLDAVADFVDLLLESSETCRLLVTSREQLDIEGENTIRVGPLDPASGADLLSERAAAAGAVFGEDPRSGLDALSAALDGIPLALELAAGHLVQMSPDQLLERLEDRFSILVGGRRTRRRRQQTLSAVVDWSWNALSTEEKSVLAQLSVFSGWSLESAEAVCVVTEPLPVILAGLVRRNLVVVVEGSARRFRLLETVRAYAQQKLVGEHSAADVRDRHLAHFAGVARAIGKGVSTYDEAHWVGVTDRETANIVAALRWALDTEQWTPAVDMVVGLCEEAHLRGRDDFGAFGRDLAHRLIAADDARGFEVGACLLRHGLTLEQIWPLAEDAAWGAAAVDSIYCRYLVGWHAVSARDPQTALTLVEPLADQIREDGVARLAPALAWIAMIAEMAGEQRPELAATAVDLARSLGSGSQAWILVQAAVAVDDPALSRQRLEEALDLSLASRALTIRIIASYHLARLAATDDTVTDNSALQAVQRALAFARSASGHNMGNALHYCGRTLAARGAAELGYLAIAASEGAGVEVSGRHRDPAGLAAMKAGVEAEIGPQVVAELRDLASRLDVVHVIDHLLRGLTEHGVQAERSTGP